MSPRPDVWQQATSPDQKTKPATADDPSAPILVALTDEQRQVIDLLQARRHGMTARQLEAQLSQPQGGVQTLLDSLIEQQLVARLNTLVPSYVYRYGGVDLRAE